jgi:hypothetical protein
LSTGNGLLSYDGNDIHAYTQKDGDSTSLSGHNLSQSSMDEKGNLFVVITGEEQGVYGQIDYFDTKTGKAERFKIKIEREDSSGYNMAVPFWYVCRANNNTMCYVNSTSYDLYDYRNWKQYKLSMNDGLISYLNWSTAVVNNTERSSCLKNREKLS